MAQAFAAALAGGAGGKDVPIGVRALIAECCRVGRAADTKGIEYEEKRSGHRSVNSVVEEEIGRVGRQGNCSPLAVLVPPSHCAPVATSPLGVLIQRFATGIVLQTALAGQILLGVTPGFAADWRQDIGTFRIGMIAAGAPTGGGLEALRQSYSAALGMPVDFFIARDFAMLIDAQATSRIEYAIYSTTAYATALELCRCIAPLAAPTDVDGASGIRSIVIARAGKLKSVSDLPKMKVAVPAEDDLSGWLTPLSLLAHGGLVLRGDEPFIVTSPTALEAEAQFANGKTDAILGWERVTPDGKALPQGGHDGSSSSPGHGFGPVGSGLDLPDHSIWAACRAQESRR